MKKKINFKRLILFFAVTFAIGGLAALLTSGSMKTYDEIVKPAFAPPPVIFPIVWTVLYALMATSAYLVSISSCEEKTNAITAYFIQLAMNFIWPILFFNIQAFLVSFVWLIFLWIAIFDMIRKFHACNKTAAYMQIPYLIWVTFAGCLNLMIYILNQL